MKKTLLVALLAITMTACSKPADKAAETAQVPANAEQKYKRPDELTVKAFERMGLDANKMFDLAVKVKEGTASEAEKKELLEMQAVLAKKIKVQQQAAAPSH